MKAASLPSRGGTAAFTLVEVLMVITIIGVLFGLVLAIFEYANNAYKVKATKASLGTIRSALTTYQQEAGSFPEPARPGATVEVAGKSYEVAGAAALYQALSGDGNDQIQTSEEIAQRTSDGSLDEAEATSVMLKSMPKGMWAKHGGVYFMADAWGRPLQYVKALDTDPTQATAPPPVTINATYDLWSYGPDRDHTTARSIDTRTDTTLKAESRRWIVNW